MLLNEKVLMFESKANSPLMYIDHAMMVEMTSGEAGDEVELIVLKDDGTQERYLYQYGQPMEFLVRDCFVRVNRVSGDGPITVLLYQ